jgi:hypothetical protein
MKSQSATGLAFLISIGRFLGQAGPFGESAHIIPCGTGSQSAWAWQRNTLRGCFSVVIFLNREAREEREENL